MYMLTFWRSWKEKLLHFAYPEWCQFCRAEPGLAASGYVGTACQAESKPIVSPFCACCGQPSWGEIEGVYVCGECRAEPPHFSTARAGVRLDGTVREAIHRYKYNRALWVEPFLVGHLREAFERLPQASDSWDMMVPVPLHAKRRRLRQFNQAEELARGLASSCNLHVETEALARVVDSPTQTRLSRAERFENLKHAFIVRRPELIRGRRVILIDDVLTSGATASFCARELRKAGAAEIAVCTVARTQTNG